MGGTRALNMDMNHPDNNVSFSKKSGCYLSRFAVFVMFVVFISALAATGFLVFYYLSEVRSTVQDVKSFFGNLVGNDGMDKDTETHLPISTTMRMLTDIPKLDSEVDGSFSDNYVLNNDISLENRIPGVTVSNDISVENNIPEVTVSFTKDKILEVTESSKMNNKVPESTTEDTIAEITKISNMDKMEEVAVISTVENLTESTSAVENLTESTSAVENLTESTSGLQNIKNETLPGDFSSDTISPDLPTWARRLPRDLKPVHYTVKLQPFVNTNFSIHGSVQIDIDVLEQTSKIVLHIADIITLNDTVKVYKLGQVNGPELKIMRHGYNPQGEFYTAQLEKPLEKGNRYRMTMQFEGHLNDNMKGFYRSSYEDADGSQKYLAATQFQASDARRAFPCFDEPGFKATFDIYLGREESMKTLSNMPLVKTIPFTDQEGWLWDRYNTTPIMSTYLLAFAVSDFVSLNSTNENWMFRVWARESAIEQAEYALWFGERNLQHFEKFFKLPYPLPKMDMIALPDFAPGAMENWGLVTFRETLMLYDPSTSSAANKQLIASVTSHEMAHQYFGNLVTPKWWTEIWLNEGFASYVEYIGVDAIEPSFQIMEQFVARRIHRIFQEDSLESSHPLIHDALNADSIAYDKGSSILRMMNHFLTDASFTKGLHHYLVGLQYANADQDDLWNHLTMAAHEDQILPHDLTVKSIMDTWTLQMGYPVIKVVRSPDGTTATISQERFLQKKQENHTGDHDYKWWVPLTYTSMKNSNFSSTKAMVWMKPTESSITLDNSFPPNDQWVIFNLQETGFYRVNYDDHNWKLIADQLMFNHSLINTINRAQILDDSLNLAKAGQLPYETALSLYKYLKAEDEYVPWDTALNNLGYLKGLLKSTPAYEGFKKYLLSLLSPLYDSLGFEDHPDDPQLSQFKRQKILAWACGLDHKDCLENSAHMYHQWQMDHTNTSIISPNLKSMVYCRAIQRGGEAEWNFAWQQYLQANTGAEKERLLSAMACTEDQLILSKYLKMAFTEDSGIRKQDCRRVFQAIASNPKGNSLAWNFLKENWIQIYNYFDSILVSLTGSASWDFNSQQQLTELQMLVDEIGTKMPDRKLDLDQVLEKVRNNVSWMDDYYDTIVNWLQINVVD